MGKVQKKQQRKEEEKKSTKFTRQKEYKQQKHGDGQYIKDPNSMTSKQTLDGYTIVQKSQFIQEVSEFIITQPETYLNHIQSLLYLLQGDNQLIMKLACYSIVEIFKDIAPSYEIDYKKHQEKLKGQVKKEERLILQFEVSVCEFYKKYTDMLLILARPSQVDSDKNKRLSKKHAKKNKKVELTEEQLKTQKEMKLMALKCLLELMKSLSHFNLSNSLVQQVVQNLLSHDKDISQIVYDKVAEILEDKQHTLYGIKIIIMRDLGKMIQLKEDHQLPDNFVQLVNNIQIDSRYLKKNVEQDEKEKKLSAKKRKKQYYVELEKAKKEGKDLKKEKKHASKKRNKNVTEEEIKSERSLKKEVEKELKEAQGEMSPSQIMKYNSDILEKVYYIYFKVIKAEKISKFFNDAMNGILKFVHMINVDLIWSLIQSLYLCSFALREQAYGVKNLDNMQKRLSCIYTIEEILIGPANLFDVDDKDAQMHFYHILIDYDKFDKKLNETFDRKQQILVIRILEKMFIKKRSYNYETIASYIKLLLKIILKLDFATQIAFIATLLFTIKCLIHKYPKVNRMLDEDNQGYGLDMYNDKIEDPSSTNALNTTIIEDLSLILSKTKNFDVRSLCQKLQKQEPLNTSLSTLKPLEFYEKYRNLK